MALFTIWEITQIIITILALGFIFSERKTVFTEFGHQLSEGWQLRLKNAVMIAAPAVLLHEFSHKFLALYFGFAAEYAASLWGLAIGVFLKVVGSPFIFFIPGYVSISGYGSQLAFGFVALAGPIINLVLFLFFSAAIKYNWLQDYSYIIYPSKQINLWLFIFNMLPIPGLDGFKFYASLF